MMRSPGNDEISALPHRTPFLLLLIAAGLAGNYFNFPLFNDIYLIFGSIFALLALQLFGLGRGIIAGALIASYTYLLWHHPYAIIIMTAEVGVVGWLSTHNKKMGMVLADTLYWLLIGMPLIFLFYHLVMQLPLSATKIIMIKQATNGVANALIARLIFTAMALRLRPPLIAYNEIISNLLTFFVLCPALILMAVDSRNDLSNTNHRIQTTLAGDSQHLSKRLQTWVLNRKSAILHLAELAASRSPQQMVPYLEQAKKSDVNFLRIGVHDKEATSLAYFPLIDETGRSTVGKDYADRPFIPTLRQTLKPMLSEVDISRIGIPKPRVLLLAPVVKDGEYAGFVAGALNLKQIQEYFDNSIDQKTYLYTLLDKNGKVIMTNRTDQKVMAPFHRGQGSRQRLDQGISRWVPTLPPQTSRTEEWRNSLYIAESIIGDLAEWQLILEQPVAPIQKLLYAEYTNKLTEIFLLFLGALALAEILSRQTVVALRELSNLTFELPTKLATNSKDVTWPETGIKEAQDLINNFKKMTESLSGQFSKVREINASLEQRVAERTAELQKSEEAYRTVADFTYNWEYWLAPDGRLRYMAPSCVHHTGYRAEEFLHNPTLLNSITHPDDRVEFTSHLDATHKVPHHVNFRITTRAGEERWFEHVCQAVYADNGEYLGQRASNRDITENRRTEELLLDTTLAAEMANIAKSQFLANMSHEIRTPMNGVIGLIELLLGTELSKEQRKYAELIKLSGRNLVELISDILDLSKIEAQKIELESRAFDLGTEMIGIIKLLTLRAEEKGLKLNVLIDDDVPQRLKGDAGRVRQILTNIIGNAIKFTANGSVTLHVGKDTEDEEQTTLRFLVRDTGIGIAAENHEKIFEPFTQADSSSTRNFGGTGLGLTISRQFVEIMGGEIGVESSEGQGATFWFTLVLAKQTNNAPSLDRRGGDAGDAEVQTECGNSLPLPFSPARLRQEEGADSRTTTSIRLLLAEDDAINQMMTRLLLTRSGYLVDVANNGREVLKLLGENDYDLVLMDCMMPVMNGYETAAVIRDSASIVRNHAIPVIALTANAMQEDRNRSLAAGMNDYLTKPIELEKLLEILKKWLPTSSAPPAENDDESSSCPPVIAIFDREEFVNRALGDLEISRSVVTIFINNGPDYISSIQNALDAEEGNALLRSAHKLKGAAATMELRQLAETASRIETGAEAGDFEQAKVLLPTLTKDYERALEELRKLFISP